MKQELYSNYVYAMHSSHFKDKRDSLFPTDLNRLKLFLSVTHSNKLISSESQEC